LELPFGRIVRDSEGRFQEVVEDRDCTPEQKAIKELNVGVYVFQSRVLIPALSKLGRGNSQGEYYLTEVPAILRDQGLSIGVCMRELDEEIIGVNTVEQLHEVEAFLKERTER
jgi:bifunctional N-acetylglucosamine-1-phosphate-uridyltransferase/glucosamine-1-phosphate-acetyltransferase GlmU-like protein